MSKKQQVGDYYARINGRVVEVFSALEDDEPEYTFTKADAQLLLGKMQAVEVVEAAGDTWEAAQHRVADLANNASDGTHITDVNSDSISLGCTNLDIATVKSFLRRLK